MLRLIDWMQGKRDELRRRLGRALPWLTLAYGVASGLTIKRDFAHSRLLVLYFGGLVLAAIALRLWLDWLDRHEGAPPPEKPLLRELVARKDMVRNVGHFATQYCLQYIAMFCLPLLALAGAWVTLALTAALVLSTLWDRWWLFLVRSPLYLSFSRALVATLATSFAFAVLAPDDLDAFYPTLGAAALLSGLPWDAIFKRRRPTPAELAPPVTVLAAVIGQAVLGSWLRMPLLSVWLASPAMGVGVTDLKLRERFPPEVTAAQIAAALARDPQGLCCFTPVVSPSGLSAPVVHEWRVDGKVVQRIRLPAVRGLDDSGHTAFRTYSCKHNIPAAEESIVCRVYMQDSLYLGDVTLDVTP